MITADPTEAALERRFALVRAAVTAGGPPRRRRRDHLRTLERLVKDNAAAIAQAIEADFGRRSYSETALTEIVPTIEAARYARRNLRRWMACESAAVPPYLWPGTARVCFQPVGVVGIIAPWNYPLVLSFGPLVAALAAGNRVMLKLSEFSPHTTELLATLLHASFAPDHIALVGGGAEIGKAFAALPFDHLLFTGSTATGRSVMRAAADNLTPVTLELGGKSPAIIDPSANVTAAAERITAAKCLNAGQTCIAPDYVLLPVAARAAFVSAARSCVARLYPALPANRDYTSIISATHVARIAELLADATAKGATVVPLSSDGEPQLAAGRIVGPSIVLDVNDEMRLMQEEVFGPILPLRTYERLDDAIAYVNDRARPLALYFFGPERIGRTVIERTRSGGACINDLLLQFAVPALPFGGTGASGMGAYHGRAGFETFSHERAVFAQRPINGIRFLNPPYGVLTKTIVRLLQR